MVSKKKAFLYLFLIIANDFRQTKAFVIDREIIEECITILFATVGVYITVYKTLYFLAPYFLNRNQKNSINNKLAESNIPPAPPNFSSLNTILKEQAYAMVDKHYHKNLLFLLIRGNKTEVDDQINLFIQYLAHKKLSINFKLFSKKNDLKTIFNLAKTPLATMGIDLVFISISVKTNNHPLQVAIDTQHSYLKWFQKKHRFTLIPFLNNPEELQSLETLLENYKRYDIFYTPPKERAFQIVCVNQETHDRQFIECLKQYITAHLALVNPENPAKKVLCINADSLKSYAWYNYQNSIFLVLDNACDIKLNTISYSYNSLKTNDDFT